MRKGKGLLGAISDSVFGKDQVGARLPGNLKKSIGSWSLKKGARYSGSAVVVVVGTRGIGWYGRFIELGTRFIKARPFMRPAYDANVSKVYEILKTEISVRLDKVIANLKAKGKLK